MAGIREGISRVDFFARQENYFLRIISIGININEGKARASPSVTQKHDGRSHLPRRLW
jgi:hypothetical protein